MFHLKLTSRPLSYMAITLASDRPLGAVLEGADHAESLLEAAKSIDPSRLEELLSHQQYRQVALDECLRVHHELDVVDGQRYVVATHVTNLQYIVQTAAEHGQVAPLAAAISFATSAQLQGPSYITTETITAVISSGSESLCQALLTGDPQFVNRDLGHGLRPLNLAKLQKHKAVEDWLLHQGADATAPVPKLFQPRGAV